MVLAAHGLFGGLPLLQVSRFGQGRRHSAGTWALTHAHALGRFCLSLGQFEWFLEDTTCPAVFCTPSQPLLPRFDTPRREAVLPPDWSARHLCHPYRLPPFCGLFQPFFPVGLLRAAILCRPKLSFLLLPLMQPIFAWRLSWSRIVLSIALTIVEAAIALCNSLVVSWSLWSVCASLSL